LLRRFAISGANSSGGSFYVENSSLNSPAVFFNASGAGSASIGLLADGGSGIGIYTKGTAIDFGLGVSGTIENGSGNKVLMDNDFIYADTIANRVLEDSSSYKNFDSAQVASAVWNSPQGNHTGAGTFGKYLDAEISGLSGGGLVVVDSGTGQTIPGVSLTLRNLDQSALIAVGTTNILGTAAFNLNAESYIAIASSPGYIFENFDTVIVAGAGIDTVFGCRFDAGTPADPLVLILSLVAGSMPEHRRTRVSAGSMDICMILRVTRRKTPRWRSGFRPVSAVSAPRLSRRFAKRPKLMIRGTADMR